MVLPYRVAVFANTQLGFHVANEIKEQKSATLTASPKDMRPLSVRAIEKLATIEEKGEKVQSRPPSNANLASQAHPDGRVFSKSELSSRKILADRSMDHRLAAEFFALKSNIQHRVFSGEVGVIFVMGALPDVGATFTTVNLAATLRSSGHPVIVIDCDSETLGLTKMMELENHNGVSEYLAGTVDAERVIYESPLENVNIIPAGQTPRPTNNFGGDDKLQQLVSHCRQTAPKSWIVIDGPALAQSVDNRALTEISDCTLLVVPYAKITPNRLRSMLEGINRNKIAGVMINRMPTLMRNG